MRAPSVSLAFALAALVTAALSLAAALIAISAGSEAKPRDALSDDVAARNQRIAFFEQRAQADVLDTRSLNTLAFEYLQRAREVGDPADYARAETAATRSLTIVANDNLNGRLALASVKLVQHDFAGALVLADQALALRPADVTGNGLKGDALAGLGRYEEAGRAYQRMVELEPALPALSRLAYLAFIEGDLLNAGDFWKQAIERGAGLPAENLAWAETQLGRFYFERGDLGRAEKQFKQALRRAPGYVHANAGLAAVRAGQKRWDDAIALYTEAQARLPQLEYVIALGYVYAKAGRTAEDRAQYELVEVIATLYAANGINTDLQLALFYVDHDQVEPALASAESAYNASPTVYAADVYAWALFKAGRLEEAGSKMAEALRLGSPAARFYYHAGIIRRAVGDDDGARAHLERALRINPVFSPLQADHARGVLAEIKAGR